MRSTLHEQVLRSESIRRTGSVRRHAALGMQTGVPLCVHYFSAHFYEQPVQVLAGVGALRELTVTWALGVLSDGEQEVLGSWPAPDGGPALWRRVFNEFTARGVEKRLPFVMADALADARAANPCATVSPTFGRIVRCWPASVATEAGPIGSAARRAVREAASVGLARAALARLSSEPGRGRPAVLAPDWPEVLEHLEPSFELPSQRRALVRRGDEVAERLGRSVNRAVVRHGPFADADAATTFVASALARGEQRLVFYELVSPSSRLGPAARFAIKAQGA